MFRSWLAASFNRILHFTRILKYYHSLWQQNQVRDNYNIPRACLLNRSPVPAMDLKSNRSGLWCHMLETCHRLRRLCRKISNDVVGHDKTPVKSTLLSRDMSFMSRRIDIMSFYKLQYMHFEFAYFCSVAIYDIIFWCRPVYYKTLILWNIQIYTILKPCKWRYKPSQSSQRILACGSYSPYKIWLGLWRNFYGFKMVQIRLFHRISVK